MDVDIALAPLRTLDAIARHGSFSRAARELNLTQPAVSMQVAQLERRLGLPLLERVGKRAFPTRAGEVLLAHAARAFRELQAGIEHVQELRGVVAGRVRLGTSASISVYLLPQALGRFRARFPAIDLVVVTGTASDVARGLVANDLDVGLVSLPLRDRELTVTTSIGALAWPLAIAGVGFGIALVTMTASVLAIVAPQQSGMAASTVNTSRGYCCESRSITAGRSPAFIISVLPIRISPPVGSARNSISRTLCRKSSNTATDHLSKTRP